MKVELQNVASIKSQNGLPYVDVDLSYLEEFENVKFIICLKPTFYGCKNFEIKYSNKRLKCADNKGNFIHYFAPKKIFSKDSLELYKEICESQQKIFNVTEKN